jgi:hypothetical protein
MGMVWESGLPKNMKMTLLAYADHASDDGGDVFPGEKWMADKTSDSPGNVRRVTKLLIEDGVLVRVLRGQPGQRAEFRIDLPKLAAHIARHSKLAAQPRQEWRASQLTMARTGATPNIKNHHDPSDIAAKPQHDLMTSAIVDSMGWHMDSIPESMWGRIHAAAKQLTAINADPSEVPARVAQYPVVFPGASMTPNAIAVNWPALDAACTHAYSDGHTAVATITKAGVDVRRCGKCYTEI